MAKILSKARKQNRGRYAHIIDNLPKKSVAKQLGYGSDAFRIKWLEDKKRGSLYVSEVLYMWVAGTGMFHNIVANESEKHPRFVGFNDIDSYARVEFEEDIEAITDAIEANTKFEKKMPVTSQKKKKQSGMSITKEDMTPNDDEDDDEDDVEEEVDTTDQDSGDPDIVGVDLEDQEDEDQNTNKKTTTKTKPKSNTKAKTKKAAVKKGVKAPRK